MESFPYFFGFSLICFILSYGIQCRKVWAWYAGWLVLFVIAALHGELWFTAFHEARDLTQMGFATLGILGGFFIWLPAAIWWGNHRHLFGGKAVSHEPTATGQDHSSTGTALTGAVPTGSTVDPALGTELSAVPTIKEETPRPH